MIAKKISVVALSGLTAALALSAQAQDTTTTTTSGNMTGTMSDSTSMGGGSMGGGMSASMSMQPMPVTGTVLRYYTDRSGYVTAMDVQTAEGVRMVRFAPGMAQRLYSTYPVGGQITGTIQPSMMGRSTRYDLISMGETMPAAGMMQPYTVSDIELLRADPYIMAGTRMTQFRGKLRSIVTDDMGEILGLVLNDISPQSVLGGSMGGGTMSGTGMDASTGTMGGGMMGGGMMGGQNTVLVRVPRELRHPSGAQYAGSPRVTPLFKGSDVEVVGYNEAPRYGVVSNYGGRVAASALVVNGRAVGAVGLPMIKPGRSALLSLNIGGTTEERNAGSMGYTTYSTDGNMTSGSNTTTDTSMTTGGTGGGM